MSGLTRAHSVATVRESAGLRLMRERRREKASLLPCMVARDLKQNRSLDGEPVDRVSRVRARSRPGSVRGCSARPCCAHTSEFRHGSANLRAEKPLRSRRRPGSTSGARRRVADEGTIQGFRASREPNVFCLLSRREPARLSPTRISQPGLGADVKGAAGLSDPHRVRPNWCRVPR